MSMGAYIRAKVLERPHRRKHNVRRATPADKALLRVLTELGRTQAYNNLNQIARKANAGGLPMTPEVEAALLDACRSIQKMRRAIVHYLRRQEG
ncbi:MAG: plasmid mobilization relaxosome protein MobC [Alphaproteobacteria bacterium]|nr:plasmid mobilization relaxosome protein MobC [Alphaproteobacteria bacterium]